MATATTKRLVDADTPHGDDMWFRQMTGTDALSIPFEYDVTFHSLVPGLSAKAMLGHSVTLKLETHGGGARRPFNGICTRFASGGREGQHLVYTAKLRPWLWLASRRSDCKIFQHKTVPQIIELVLTQYGFPMSKKLSKTYREWDYCVQYQETDLNFVMRLAEHEGIYFYFKHSVGSHELVFIDDINTHSDMPGASTIKYYGADASAVVREEHFNSWDVREEVDPGEYIANDYDFKKPKADLTTQRQHLMGHDHDKWERYTWPGGYVTTGDGDNYAKSHIETLQAEQERVHGHCTVRTMAPGYSFTLANCPRADQNRKYLAVAATYFLRNNAISSAGGGDGDAAWGITVTSQPTTVPYRPQPLTPKPLTNGPQTALVVGPAGEEIHTDEYGRVKVHFYWDRYDSKDQDSSCWIRVSQPWAGEKWGFIHLPRIGQEVIVDFIGGDPDYPIITGRVYNADQMPPYELPKNKTASGIKSRSTKGGSPTDFNEIRMEDLKGKEQLYIHAQRNLDTVVENDESRIVGHDRATRIEHDDDRFVVNDDRHVVKGNQTIQIDKDHNTKVKGEQNNSVDKDQTNVVHGKRTQSIDKDLKEHTGGNHQETVQGNHSFTVEKDEYNIISKNQTNKIGGDRTVIVMGNTNIVSIGKTTMLASQGFSMSTLPGTKYAESTTFREAHVEGTDTTNIKGLQSETIMGGRTTDITGADMTTIKGVHSHSVTGVSTQSATLGMTISSPLIISVSGSVVTITGAAAINMTAPLISMTAATAIALNAPAVTLNAGVVTVAGVATGPAFLSAAYMKGPLNIV